MIPVYSYYGHHLWLQVDHSLDIYDPIADHSKMVCEIIIWLVWPDYDQPGRETRSAKQKSFWSSNYQKLNVVATNVCRHLIKFRKGFRLIKKRQELLIIFTVFHFLPFLSTWTFCSRIFQTNYISNFLDRENRQHGCSERILQCLKN